MNASYVIAFIVAPLFIAAVAYVAVLLYERACRKAAFLGGKSGNQNHRGANAPHLSKMEHGDDGDLARPERDDLLSGIRAGIKDNGAGRSAEVFVPVDAMIRDAEERGRLLEETEPRATSARYDPKTRQIHVTTIRHDSFKFDPHSLRELAGATDEQLALVEVIGRGSGLHWEVLDVDIYVPYLAGQFGQGPLDRDAR